MILQRDSRLPDSINRWGCYYMALLYLANKHARAEWDADSIKSMYWRAVREGWMLDDCRVILPDRILGAAGLQCDYLGHIGPTYPCGESEIEILRYVRGRQAHFVAGDGTGRATYDPWGVSRCVAEGTLESKRVFRLVG